MQFLVINIFNGIYSTHNRFMFTFFINILTNIPHIQDRTVQRKIKNILNYP